MKEGPLYYPAIMAGDTLYACGQLAIGANGETVGEGDIVVQTRQALLNLKALLAQHDMEMKNLISVTVYLQDIDRDFAGMNEAYREVMDGARPARATVQAKLFKPEFLVEITAVASRLADNR